MGMTIDEAIKVGDKNMIKDRQQRQLLKQRTIIEIDYSKAAPIKKEPKIIKDTKYYAEKVLDFLDERRGYGYSIKEISIGIKYLIFDNFDKRDFASIMILASSISKNQNDKMVIANGYYGMNTKEGENMARKEINVDKTKCKLSYIPETEIVINADGNILMPIIQDHKAGYICVHKDGTKHFVAYKTFHEIK